MLLRQEQRLHIYLLIHFKLWTRLRRKNLIVGGTSERFGRGCEEEEVVEEEPDQFLVRLVLEKSSAMQKLSLVQAICFRIENKFLSMKEKIKTNRGTNIQ